MNFTSEKMRHQPPRPSAHSSQGRGTGGRRWSIGGSPISLIVVSILAVLTLGPMIRLGMEAWSDGAGGIRDLATYPNIGKILWNTVVLALGSLVVALILGVTMAYLVTRLPPKIKPILSVFPMIPLVVPSVAATVGWVFLFSPQVGYLNTALRAMGLGDGSGSGPVDVFTFEWIVLLTGVTLSGYIYLFVHSSMETIGGELTAAARVSGASDFRAFITVMLPLVRPSVTYGAGIVFLLGVGQFTNPLILGTANNVEVLTTVLFRVYGSYPINYALGSAISTPILIIGLIAMWAQQRAIGAQSRYTVVSGKSNYQAVRTSWWAAVPILGYFLFVLVLPIGAILIVLLSPYWSGTVDVSSFTTANIVDTLTSSRIQAAIQTTFLAIGGALLIVVPLSLGAAMIQAGRLKARREFRWLTDLLSSLPLAMPAAIFGFAAAYTYGIKPIGLQGTVWIIVIAYVTLMIPHAFRPQLAAIMSTGTEYVEASRMSGASRLRTFLRVELPMTRAGIVLAASMVVILLSHEFAASIMIISPKTQVIGTLLYDSYVNGTYAQVAGIAMVMVVVTSLALVVIALVNRMTKSKAQR